MLEDALSLHAPSEAEPNEGWISEPRSDRWGDMMLAAKRGDDIVYDVLIREAGEWLQRYFRRRMSVTAAEDAVQDTLLAVHCRRFTYEASGPFGPWLASIARHKWMDRLRLQYRDPGTTSDGTELAVDDHGKAVRSRIVLDLVLDKLSPAQAAAVRLVKLHGASVQEASQMTGQSVSLVKVNIHRGLRKIAVYLGSGVASEAHMPAVRPSEEAAPASHRADVTSTRATTDHARFREAR